MDLGCIVAGITNVAVKIGVITWLFESGVRRNVSDFRGMYKCLSRIGLKIID